MTKLTKTQVDLLTELEATLIDLGTIPKELTGQAWDYYTKYVTDATIQCVNGKISMKVIKDCFDAFQTQVPVHRLIGNKSKWIR